MKKLKSILLVIPALLLMLSCGDDFTNLAPHSERNVENFYRTPTDFEVALNGAYSGLAGNKLFGRNVMLLHEMRSDNTANAAGATGLSESLERLTLFTELTTASELYNIWSGGYETIARANTILSRLPGSLIENTAVKDRIRGEALFIRSLVYYKLAITFGNIAAQFEEVTSPNITLNQVSANVIYDQIAQDLTEAKGLLPAIFPASEAGRATSGAAATLLGLVHLTNGNNSAAETALREVVQSGQYSLIPNYANIWGAGNENNAESVFEIQYKSGGQGTGSQYTEYYAVPLRLSGGVGDGNVPQGVNDNLLEIWEDGDERFDGTFGLTEAENHYIRKYDGAQFTVFDSDNNLIVFRYADVLLMLAEALGDTPEANGLINQVRQRSGLTTPVQDLPGSFADKLLMERRREFVGENKRWPDLLRFGKAKPVMAALFSNLGYTEANIRLLYPIPQQEIDAAGGDLTQNPL